MDEETKSVVFSLVRIHDKLQGMDPSTEICGMKRDGLMRLFGKTHELIWHQEDRVRKLEAIVDTFRMAYKPVIKDEHHWYCGACGKRIPLKKKPKFCLKCGVKIDL